MFAIGIWLIFIIFAIAYDAYKKDSANKGKTFKEFLNSEADSSVKPSGSVSQSIDIPPDEKKRTYVIEKDPKRRERIMMKDSDNAAHGHLSVANRDEDCAYHSHLSKESRDDEKEWFN